MESILRASYPIVHEVPLPESKKTNPVKGANGCDKCSNVQLAAPTQNANASQRVSLATRSAASSRSMSSASAMSQINSRSLVRMIPSDAVT